MALRTAFRAVPEMCCTFGERERSLRRLPFFEHGFMVDVIMCGVAGASIASGRFEVNVHFPQELANVNWDAWDELRLQWSDTAQHVRLEWA